MLRMYITFDDGVIWPDRMKLASPKRRAKAARRTRLPASTPPGARVAVGDLVAGAVFVVELGCLRVGDHEAAGVAAYPVVDLRPGAGQRAGCRWAAGSGA